MTQRTDRRMSHPISFRIDILYSKLFTFSTGLIALAPALTGCSFYPQNKSVGVPFCAAGEGEVYELVVRRNGGAPSERVDIRTLLGDKPGFRCALPLTGLEDQHLEADLVVWANVDAARKAPGDSSTNGGGALVTGFFAETNWNEPATER